MFRIQRGSDTPLASQIVQELADRIHSGMLNEGDALPSVRDLSKALGVSLVTVVEGYRGLEQLGLIERIQGKGTFVKARRMTKPVPVDGPDMDWQLGVVDYLPRTSVFRQHHSTNAQVPYQMSIASLDPKLLTKVWSNDLEAAATLHAKHVFEYGPIEGLYELRQAVATYLKKHDLATSPEELFITNGAQQAIEIAARTFLGPNDIVAVESPTYPGALDVFRSRGATILPIPMDEEGIRVDWLIKHSDRQPPKMIYTMPTHHNPTGITMSRKRRIDLMAFAQACGTIIIEDDVFADCGFETSPNALKTLDRNGHVIYIRGFSKTFTPGCRVAAVVASGMIRNRMIAAKSVSDLGSPTLTQSAVARLITSSSNKRRIDMLKGHLKEKRDLTLNVLARHAPKGVSWTTPSGGFNVWMTLPAHMNTDDILIEAIQQGISFLPGSACHLDGSMRHQLRISYSYLENEQLVKGLTDLCALLRQSMEATASGRTPII